MEQEKKFSILRPAMVNRINREMESTQMVPKSKAVYFVDKPAVVFDLDETLVSTSMLPPQNVDFFTVIIRRRKVYVQCRPGLLQFLNRIQNLYDVYFYSASQSDYGNQIIDKIAPAINTQRRFFRDACINISGYSVKDLSRLGRSLHQILLVDDTIGSGLMNPENMIRIKPWSGEKEDDVLMGELLPILENIVTSSNVTKAAREAIHSRSSKQLWCLETR